MSTGISLSIVIPVYNGADTIAEVVKNVDSLELPDLKQVVLVVDGSPDNSLEVCRDLCVDFRFPISVIELAKNFGEHNAVMAGLNFCDSDFVITMDDDLQNPVSEVHNLFEYTRKNNYDVVYGQYRVKMHSGWRNLGSRFANWCVEKTQGKPKDIYLASFRCMTRMVVESICRYTGPFPYIDGLILQTTRNIGSLEVEHLPRWQGSSNYSLTKLFRLFSSMLFNFSIMPLRIGAIAGGILSLLGFLGFLAVLVEALLFSTPPGWATVSAAVFLLAGVQLMVLWLIGEYLGRLYITANHKPQFVVRSVIANEAQTGRPSGVTSVRPNAGCNSGPTSLTANKS